VSSALSLELRTRFGEYIEEGLSRRVAAARLKLSAATGVRWRRKWRETGAIAPDVQGRPAGQGKLAAHQGLLEELVEQDGDITLPELAGALASATGVVAHSGSGLPHLSGPVLLLVHDRPWVHLDEGFRCRWAVAQSTV